MRPFTAALSLLLVGLVLAAISDLSQSLPLTLAVLAIGFAVQAVVVTVLERTRQRFGMALLLVALLLRLPLLVLPPSLSDDVLRYVWDGRVAAAGENPYRLAPEATELETLRDDLWQRLPHREVPTVYPPLALGVFSIAARTPYPVFVCKVAATMADLALCALLLALARRRGLPDARAAWYAWSPLVALETAGMAHVDVLAVAPVLAAVLWLTPRSSHPGDTAAQLPSNSVALRARLASAVALAAGILAKFAPLAALPLLARWSGRPLRYAAAVLLLAVLGLAPVALAVGGVPPGLLTYGVSWEFNGPLYEPLWRLLDATGLPRLAALLLDRIEAITGRYDLLDPLYPYLYGRFLARLALALGMLSAVLFTASGRVRDPVRGCLVLFGTLLLCSATVYPWYLLWVLPWAALERSRPWLLAVALAPLVYLPQFHDLALFPLIWGIVWLPPAVLALLRPRVPAPGSPAGRVRATRVGS